MTSSKGDDMQVNDIVIFSPRQGETAEGIVTRVWDKPASDPYVTVKTMEDAPRTFTRFASACQIVKAVRVTPTPEARAAVLLEWARDGVEQYADGIAYRVLGPGA